MNKTKNVKLEYITWKSSRLQSLTYKNGRNLDNGFTSNLRPEYVDTDEAIFKMHGVECVIYPSPWASKPWENKLQIFGPPDIHVTVNVEDSEFSKDEIREVEDYMEKLMNPGEFIFQ